GEGRGMTAAPRVTGCAGGRQQADAAEVVMLRGPAAHLDSRALELSECLLVDAGLGIDDRPCAVEPRPFDRGYRVEPLVENAGGDADECGPEARSAGRADGQSDTVRADRHAWRHHALHPLAGPERRPDEVDLSEHAVQMEVEAGEEVAGPESEARGEDAHASVGV